MKSAVLLLLLSEHSLLVMAEKLFYCEACDVHLTGPQPALQHYSGTRHRKKEAAMKLVRGSAASSAATDRSTDENRSSDSSAVAVESQTGSYSSAWMRSEGGVECAADTTPTVVMVPSSNPELPPVPVTMTQNVLARCESEMNGDTGSCHLCGVQLTSHQHAEQHLSGQRHVKAKQRWQLRRAQLQETVSGLCASMMKSKPIAMCQPLVCSDTTPARQSVTDITAKHGLVAPSSTAAGTVDLLTDMQWFSCDVCNKKMNSAEMLQLHRRSPAHLRKVEQQQVAAGSVCVGDNTVWQSCPTCHKRLNSVAQLDLHMASHRRPTGVQQATPGGEWHHCDTCNKFTNTAAQLSIHQQSPAHVRRVAGQRDVVGDNTVWQVCPVCDKRLNSLKQLDIHVGSHGGRHVTASDALIGHEQLSITAAHRRAVEQSQQLSREDFDVTNLKVVDDELEMRQGASEDDVVRRAGGLHLSDDDTPQTHEPSEDVVGQMTSRAELKSAAAADVEPVTDDDVMTSGCCESASCVYHCELCDVHLNSDESRSMHVTGSKHIACWQSVNETSCSEDNPFSPQYRYHCQLCHVPLNTLRDRRQHERGQQHLAKSIRCVTAPDRLMPDVVLPADELYDSHSLTTSTPRSYQEELYLKALVADSICFLPTGKQVLVYVM